MFALLAPRFWVGHLLMVIAVAIAVGLGLWQYDAWGARRAAEASDLSERAALPLVEVMSGDDPFPGQDLGRQVSFAGSWIPESTTYVQDRIHAGERGYWVVTPVLIGESAMPVVRGWSARPESSPVRGEVEVTGWLQASEAGGRADPDPYDDTIMTMRVASLVERVDHDLYSGYVVGNRFDPPDAGLEAVTADSVPEVSSVTALRNLLYAIQWWVFGAFAAFIWWRWCRDQLADLRGDPTSDEDREPEPIASQL